MLAKMFFYMLFIGVMGASLAFLVEMLWTWQLGTLRQRETIEQRVQRLTDSLHEATALIGSIEAEINARSALVEQLENKSQTYDVLVKIKQSEVEAVAQLIRGELKSEGRATFWKGFAVNFLFFVLGAVMSLVITLWS